MLKFNTATVQLNILDNQDLNTSYVKVQWTRSTSKRKS